MKWSVTGPENCELCPLRPRPTLEGDHPWKPLVVASISKATADLDSPDPSPFGTLTAFAVNCAALAAFGGIGG